MFGAPFFGQAYFGEGPVVTVQSKALANTDSISNTVARVVHSVKAIADTVQINEIRSSPGLVRTIIIDHTKCGTSDTANFPVLISGTYSYLKTVANGGDVKNANGYDIGFYADAALTTKLNWETELYTPSTGTVVYWVKVPNVSASVDTVIYMGYGDPSITTDQSTPTSVWDSNYLAVYHFGTSSSLSIADSTTVNNGSVNAATAIAGQINGGANFVAASSQYISCPATGYTVGQNSPLTIEFWHKGTTAADCNVGYIAPSTFRGYRVFTNGLSVGRAELQINGALGSLGAVGATNIIDGNRHHVVATYDGAGVVTGMFAYIDGIVDSMTANNLDPSVGTVPQPGFDMGGASAIGDFGTFEIDEVRVSNTRRSASYILASYNNQKTPSTFYTLSAPVARPGVTLHGAVSNSNPISEAVARIVHDSKALSNTDQISETVAKAETHGVSDTDLISAATTKAIVLLKALADTDQISNAEAEAAALHVALSQSDPISDSVASHPHPSKPLTDTDLISNSIARVVTLHTSIADTDSISDAVAKAETHGVSNTDLISEAVTRTVGLHKTLADTDSISDSVAKALADHPAISDTDTISDAVTKAVADHKAISDTDLISDSTAAIFTPVSGSQSATASDTDQISNSVARVIKPRRTPADTAEIGQGANPGVVVRAITIDHTLAGTVDSTNFPVLISGTYPYLRTLANGGLVANANGYDIGFYADAALTTKLAWETEKYVASTGEVVYWVNIPTLSHTSDTVIYMSYGDSLISTDQSNATGTWNPNFKAVYHFPNGTSLTANDSTSNAYHLTGTNGPTAAPGQIDGGVGLVSASSEYLSATGAPLTAYPFTFSAWVKVTASTPEQIVVAIVDPTSLNEWWLSVGTVGGTYTRLVAQNAGTPSVLRAVQSLDTGWHLFHAVAPSSDHNTWGIYYDGGALSVAGVNSNNITPSGLSKIFVGAFIYNTSNLYQPLDGTLDEVRVANSVRTQSWVTAEFNNQSSPSTFYTVGPALTRVAVAVHVTKGVANTDSISDAVARITSIHTTPSNTDQISDTTNTVYTPGNQHIVATASDTDAISETTARAVSDHAGRGDTDAISNSVARAVALHKGNADTDLISETVAKTESDHVGNSDTDAISESTARAISDHAACADTDAISNTVTRAVTLHRALSDTDQISDTVAKAETHGVSDTDLISDAVTKAVGLHKALADTDLISEATTVAVALHRANADTDQISNTTAKASTDHPACADTDQISNAVTRAVSLHKTLADTDLISATTVASQVRQANPPDTDQISETVAKAVALHRGNADTDLISETVAKAETHGVADSDLISDSVAKAVADHKAIADTDLISETCAPAPSDKKTNADTDAISETTTKAVALRKNISDTDLISETVAHAETHGVSDVDLISEAVTKAVALHRSNADTDQISETITSAQARSASPADIDQISDSTAQIISLHKGISDTDQISDAKAIAETHAVNDTDTLSDAVTKAAAVHKSNADTDQISEIVAKAVSLHKSNADTDQISETLTSHRTVQVGVSDTDQISETAAKRIADHPTASDADQISDSTQPAVSLHKNINDTDLISETVIATRTSYAHPADTDEISDHATSGQRAFSAAVHDTDQISALVVAVRNLFHTLLLSPLLAPPITDGVNDVVLAVQPLSALPATDGTNGVVLERSVIDYNWSYSEGYGEDDATQTIPYNGTNSVEIEITDESTVTIDNGIDGFTINPG